MDNSGIITNAASAVDLDRLGKYTGGKITLVAQGGGQRGIFTSGVLDAFILSEFDPFHEFYGTSAGALNLCGFFSRQHGLGRSFILDLTTSSDFFNLFRYIRKKQFLGLDWALNTLCEFPYQLDIDLGRKKLGQRRAFAAVTHAHSYRDHYFPIFREDWHNIMIATCAIPRLYNQSVELDGAEYVDGGVSAAIPVQQAWRQGARCIVVIRTEGQDIDDDCEVKEMSVPNTEMEWFRDSFSSIQEQWSQKVQQWKSDWNSFFYQQVERSKQQKKDHIHLESLNGGRWLFGADDVYRVSHLLGEKFDSGLADMLMVHYQTYSLTQDFLNAPPDDCFIVQIKPEGPLRSSSLMSKEENLLHDYEMGLDAGKRFVEAFNSIFKGEHHG
ncbi:DUF6363 domain-containing protein [Vibrio sp. S4M6]|uniref:patatin-like phospholipase family protein n=1 Tax=Vibrio sinus TaxID=2946865 RepID=UPI00202A8D05|nr:patatin-like phospholipase family protein [Vibrio sinus]MCL9783602.1 DUF6363 domain-containing protein [Vibrio sinus]